MSSGGYSSMLIFFDDHTWTVEENPLAPTVSVTVKRRENWGRSLASTRHDFHRILCIPRAHLRCSRYAKTLKNSSQGGLRKRNV
jgi:hypothetical protein